MLMRLLIPGAMAVARLVELRFSRRNLKSAVEPREGAASRITFPVMVLMHTAVMAATALKGGRVSPGWFALLVAMQPLRLWVLLTLGRRWSVKGAVSSHQAVVTHGPYAYVRHPNYVVVFIELLALPMAFGLRRLALATTLLHIFLLAVRIRDEERLLFQLPAYRQHFEHKTRFLPRIRSTKQDVT